MRVRGRSLEAMLEHVYRFHPNLVKAWVESLFEEIEEDESG